MEQKDEDTKSVTRSVSSESNAATAISVVRFNVVDDTLFSLLYNFHREQQLPQLFDISWVILTAIQLIGTAVYFHSWPLANSFRNGVIEFFGYLNFSVSWRSDPFLLVMNIVSVLICFLTIAGLVSITIFREKQSPVAEGLSKTVNITGQFLAHWFYLPLVNVFCGNYLCYATTKSVSITCKNSERIALVIVGTIFLVLIFFWALIVRLFIFHHDWKKGRYFATQSGIYSAAMLVFSTIVVILHVFLNGSPIITSVISLVISGLMLIIVCVGQPYVHYAGNMLWSMAWAAVFVSFVVSLLCDVLGTQVTWINAIIWVVFGVGGVGFAALMALASMKRAKLLWAMRPGEAIPVVKERKNEMVILSSNSYLMSSSPMSGAASSSLGSMIYPNYGRTPRGIAPAASGMTYSTPRVVAPSTLAASSPSTAHLPPTAAQSQYSAFGASPAVSTGTGDASMNASVASSNAASGCLTPQTSAADANASGSSSPSLTPPPSIAVPQTVPLLAPSSSVGSIGSSTSSSSSSSSSSAAASAASSASSSSSSTSTTNISTVPSSSSSSSSPSNQIQSPLSKTLSPMNQSSHLFASSSFLSTSQSTLPPVSGGERSFQSSQTQIPPLRVATSSAKLKSPLPATQIGSTSLSHTLSTSSTGQLSSLANSDQTAAERKPQPAARILPKMRSVSAVQRSIRFMSDKTLRKDQNSIALCENILTAAQKRMSGSSSLWITIALFHHSYTHNDDHMGDALRSAKQCIPNVIERWVIYALLHDMERKTARSQSTPGGVSLGVQFKLQFAKGTKAHEMSRAYLSQAYLMLSKENLDLEKIQLFLEKAIKYEQEAHLTFSAMLKKYPSSAQLLRAFGALLRDIYRDDETATLLFTEANAIEDESLESIDESHDNRSRASGGSKLSSLAGRSLDIRSSAGVSIGGAGGSILAREEKRKKKKKHTGRSATLMIEESKKKLLPYFLPLIVISMIVMIASLIASFVLAIVNFSTSTTSVNAITGSTGIIRSFCEVLMNAKYLSLRRMNESATPPNLDMTNITYVQSYAELCTTLLDVMKSISTSLCDVYGLTDKEEHFEQWEQDDIPQLWLEVLRNPVTYVDEVQTITQSHTNLIDLVTSSANIAYDLVESWDMDDPSVNSWLYYMRANAPVTGTEAIKKIAINYSISSKENAVLIGVIILIIGSVTLIVPLIAVTVQYLITFRMLKKGRNEIFLQICMSPKDEILQLKRRLDESEHDDDEDTTLRVDSVTATTTAHDAEVTERSISSEAGNANGAENNTEEEISHYVEIGVREHAKTPRVSNMNGFFGANHRDSMVMGGSMVSVVGQPSEMASVRTMDSFVYNPTAGAMNSFGETPRLAFSDSLALTQMANAYSSSQLDLANGGMGMGSGIGNAGTSNGGGLSQITTSASMPFLGVSSTPRSIAGLGMGGGMGIQQQYTSTPRSQVLFGDIGLSGMPIGSTPRSVSGLSAMGRLNGMSSQSQLGMGQRGRVGISSTQSLFQDITPPMTNTMQLSAPMDQRPFSQSLTEHCQGYIQPQMSQPMSMQDAAVTEPLNFGMGQEYDTLNNANSHKESVNESLTEHSKSIRQRQLEEELQREKDKENEEREEEKAELEEKIRKLSLLPLSFYAKAILGILVIVGFDLGFYIVTFTCLQSITRYNNSQFLSGYRSVLMNIIVMLSLNLADNTIAPLPQNNFTVPFSTNPVWNDLTHLSHNHTEIQMLVQRLYQFVSILNTKILMGSKANDPAVQTGDTLIDPLDTPKLLTEGSAVVSLMYTEVDCLMMKRETCTPGRLYGITGNFTGLDALMTKFDLAVIFLMNTTNDPALMDFRTDEIQVVNSLIQNDLLGGLAKFRTAIKTLQSQNIDRSETMLYTFFALAIVFMMIGFLCCLIPTKQDLFSVANCTMKMADLDPAADVAERTGMGTASWRESYTSDCIRMDNEHKEILLWLAMAAASIDSDINVKKQTDELLELKHNNAEAMEVLSLLKSAKASNKHDSDFADEATMNSRLHTQRKAVGKTLGILVRSTLSGLSDEEHLMHKHHIVGAHRKEHYLSHSNFIRKIQSAVLHIASAAKSKKEPIPPQFARRLTDIYTGWLSEHVVRLDRELFALLNGKAPPSELEKEVSLKDFVIPHSYSQFLDSDNASLQDKSLFEKLMKFLGFTSSHALHHGMKLMKPTSEMEHDKKS